AVSKPWQAISPGAVQRALKLASAPEVVFDTVTVTPAEVAELPNASTALAASTCDPFVNVVVSKERLYGEVVSAAPTLAPSTSNCTLVMVLPVSVAVAESVV